MSKKKTIGLVLALLGIALIFLSIYINRQVASELGSVHRKTEMMQNNPLTNAGGKEAKQVTGKAKEMINQMADDKAAPYNETAMWSLISGIVLLVIGTTVIIFPKKTNSHH